MIKVDENGLTIINGKYGPINPKLETFYVRRGCGCCYDELKFKDELSIREAFIEAGLDSSATIEDEAGVTHKNVDTFYGWSKALIDQEEKTFLSMFQNRI